VVKNSGPDPLVRKLDPLPRIVRGQRSFHRRQHRAIRLARVEDALGKVVFSILENDPVLLERKELKGRLRLAGGDRDEKQRAARAFPDRESAGRAVDTGCATASTPVDYLHLPPGFGRLTMSDWRIQ
jgi:hypothetical protein